MGRPWNGAGMKKKAGIAERTRDNRRAARKSVMLRGTVVLESSATKLPCPIRDLSASGARTEVARDVVVLPAIVHRLDVPNHMAYAAAVAWHRHPVYGLKFHCQAAVSRDKLGSRHRPWRTHRHSVTLVQRRQHRRASGRGAGVEPWIRLL